MALTKIKTGSIADGAVASAHLSAGVGGVGSEYISATPTLSSASANRIAIGNYSSYVSPTFITKIGSTVIPNTNNAGNLIIAPDTSIFSGTQTVSVEAFDLGKLHGASATVSVDGVSNTARYWRLTNQELGGYLPPIYRLLHLYPLANGGGVKLGTPSGITVSYGHSSYNPQDLYAGTSTSSTAWYLSGYTGTLASHWVQYDLGSAQEVLSVSWANHSYTTNYYASSFTIENSNDGTNWLGIKDVTQYNGGNTPRTINL